MQTRNNGKQPVEGRRDLDLENIVGNLLIAKYQVDRLRTRLADLVYGCRARISNNNKASVHVFKHNNKWYKLSLRVDEVDITPAKDIVEQESDY